MRKSLLIMSLSLTLALSQWGRLAHALNNEVTRETLRGLAGVKVVVEPMKWVIEEAGLTTDQVRNDTELKLRLAGIKVFGPEEPSMVAGNPILYVNAKVLRYRSRDRFFFHIRAELLQGVSLIRASGVKSSATTWSVYVAGTSHKLATVREQLGELLELFINAYLSVNPK